MQRALVLCVAQVVGEVGQGQIGGPPSEGAMDVGQSVQWKRTCLEPRVAGRIKWRIVLDNIWLIPCYLCVDLGQVV